MNGNGSELFQERMRLSEQPKACEQTWWTAIYLVKMKLKYNC